jgi:hypothetical protein
MKTSQNIITFAPLLAGDFVEVSDDFFNIEEYQIFIETNKSKLGHFAKYLICKLHDSLIIETETTDTKFSIVLNDISTYVFADTIIERNNLTIDTDNISFPIKIDFTTIEKAKYFKVDGNGNMTEIVPFKLDEYLYEQIVSIDNDQIEIVFEFWKSFKGKQPDERFIIALTTTEIQITEKMYTAWQEVFGSRFDNYFQYFRKHFVSDRNVSDHHSCMELIEEYDKIHNN